MNTPDLDLSAAGMLVHVQVRLWSARKLDRAQTAKTNKAANATADASRVNKHLLANADAALKKVQRKGNEIRAFIESQTLPWDNAGYRLLSNARAITVIGDIARLDAEFKQAVDDFVTEYPVLRAQAVANLGDMGDDSDYPQPDQVRAKFGVEITWAPIASTFGSSRPAMPDAIAAIWENQYSQKMRKHQDEATRNALLRLQENLQRYSDRLTVVDGKTGRWTDTMVEHLNDTLDLIASLSLYHSPEVAALIDDVRLNIARYSPTDLRGSMAAAASAKSEADFVLQRMASYLG